MKTRIKKRTAPLQVARPKPKESNSHKSGDVRLGHRDMMEFMHRHDGVLRIGGVPLVKGLR